MTNAPQPILTAHLAPLSQRVRLRRWWATYAVYWLLTAAPLAYLIVQQPGPCGQMLHATGQVFASFAHLNHFHEFVKQMKAAGWEFQQGFAETAPATKLLFLAVYLSMCTTFTPMPASPIVALAATRAAGIGGGLWDTMALVAAVSAIGSTMANLNDYHVFLWILRSGRIAKVRNTRTYHLAAKWFAKGPFAILVVCNMLHIPVDVVRMLAAIYGYPRGPFALANLLGRFLRYAVVVAITYELGKDKDWMAAPAFLALGLVIALAKIVPAAIRHRAEANATAAKVSNDQETVTKE